MKHLFPIPGGWSKVFVWLIPLLFSSNISSACDVCGCMAPFNAGGFLPVVRTNLVGLRYQFRSFEHPNTPLNYNGGNRVLQDQMHSSELWFRVFPHQRFQLLGSLPFSYHKRMESQQSYAIYGPGDAQVQGSWIAFMTPDSSPAHWKHGLMTGLDLQLPLGNYRQRDPNGTVLPLGFQTGSGSWGAGAHLNYTLRYKKFGLNFDGRVRVFAENESSYLPGWRMSQQLQLFYWKQGAKVQWIPMGGLLLEHYGRDRPFDISEATTGGTIAKISLGLDAYLNRWFFSGHWQQAVWQHVPEAQPIAQGRFQTALAYRF